MKKCATKTVFILLLMVFLGVAPLAVAADLYTSAAVNEAGVLHVITDKGKTIVIPREPDQVGFDRIAVAPDGRSVGWLALFPNASTSYPIPMKLIIYSNGTQRAYTGNGVPVWKWRFTAGGKQVAFEQETIHGGLNIHYEMRDVVSGRLIREWRPEIGTDNQTLPNQTGPKWVQDLEL